MPRHSRRLPARPPHHPDTTPRRATATGRVVHLPAAGPGRTHVLSDGLFTPALVDACVALGVPADARTRQRLDYLLAVLDHPAGSARRNLPPSG